MMSVFRSLPRTPSTSYILRLTPYDLGPTEHAVEGELPGIAPSFFPLLGAELLQKTIDIPLVELLELEGILYYQGHLSGVKLVRISVPEEVAKRPQRVKELVALLGEQRRSHSLYGDLHPPEELSMISSPVLDSVFEELGDDLEEIFESTIQIVELISETLQVGNPLPLASLLYPVEDPFDLPPLGLDGSLEEAQPLLVHLIPSFRIFSRRG